MTTPLERITALVSDRLDNDLFTSTPLLTLKEFFDGNDVDGSILCNLVLDDGGAVSPQLAYAELVGIRMRLFLSPRTMNLSRSRARVA